MSPMFFHFRIGLAMKRVVEFRGRMNLTIVNLERWKVEQLVAAREFERHAMLLVRGHRRFELEYGVFVVAIRG